MDSQTSVVPQILVAQKTSVAMDNKDIDTSVKKKRFIIVKRTKEKVSEHEEESSDKISPKNTLAEYISQLSDQEKIVMKIASEHLKTSFDLEKSSGYLQYLRRINTPTTV